MDKTRLRLLLDYPFFGSLALTLLHKENSNIPTCSTDGRSLNYNPQFVDNLTQNEKLFLYLHEICHIILGHSVRRKGRDPKLWNIAGDHAVNILLRESVDLPRPEGGLYNSNYQGLSAEEIYSKLNEEFPEDIRNSPPSEPEPDQEQNPEDDQENQEQNPESESEPELPFEDAQEEQAQQEQQGQDNDSELADGPEDNPEADNHESRDGVEAGRQEHIDRYNEMVNSMERFGMVEDPSEELGLTESDIQSTTSLIDRMLNKSNIETPEPIRRLVRQFVSTRVPWQELLASFIHRSCEQIYDWTRPSRRYSSLENIIMPSIDPQSTLSIVIVVDTSGSIDDALLNLFMSELTSLMNSIEYSKIHMVSCSHEVFEPVSFDKGQPLIYQPTGEGETRFEPAFEYIATIDPAPACIIYFTDLFSDNFGPEPSIPVLWIGKYEDTWMRSHKNRIPFGDIVNMNEEE